MKATIRSLAIFLAIAGASAESNGCARRPVASHGAAAPTTTTAGVGGRDAWSSLTWDERHDEMTWLIHPQMSRLFQRFEKTPYPELTCRTCHGSDAEKVQYKMPNGLPPLDPVHMPDANDGPDAEVAKFMFEEVTPTMANLLGVTVGDPRSGRGFGCFSCHPTGP
jgi:hypothetical protein